MATVPTLWQLEPATAAKHRLYKRYLDAWWPILLQPTGTGYLRPRITYVDAFCGPGEYSGGEEGSPTFVLDRLLHHDSVSRMGLRRERVRLIFIEKQRDRFDHLCALLDRRFGPLDSLPVHVDVIQGEAATHTEPALTDSGAWGHPILGVFDSWGNVNVPFSLVARIANQPASEVITTFGPNWFNRREGIDKAQLDTVFGGREHWARAHAELGPGERWKAWLGTFRDALRRAGFRFQLEFEVVPRTGVPLYLVFGTGHEKGLQVMKDAMWNVDGADGMSFRDPRTSGGVVPGQVSLFDGPTLNETELRDLALQGLASGPLSLEQLGHWFLTETARWRERDAKAAVTSLLKDGLLARQDGGRLSRSTVLGLRP